MDELPKVVEIVVTESESPVIKPGDKLTGSRYHDYAIHAYISNTYTYIGMGTCINRCKPVELYVREGQIYGVSTVLANRYFKLKKVV